MGPSTVQGIIHNTNNDSVIFTDEETDVRGQRTILSQASKLVSDRAGI